MKLPWFRSKTVLLALLATLMLAGLLAGVGYWVLLGKLPQRQGTLVLRGLHSEVSVAWDERGVPHIQAGNEADLYRTLGFLHAQDRLFQMEMVRRLARGELAEILGPKLLELDRLFRTLELRHRAQAMVASMDPHSPAWKALAAYLDGINQYQETHQQPLEFDLLGIPKRPFSPEDSLAVAGYLAYSFAAAFRTEPVLSFVRDQLGAAYLKLFDLDSRPQGVLQSQATPLRLTPDDHRTLTRLGRLSHEAFDLAGVASFEGSNAWAVSGRLTASGKPLLAGDPHIGFAAPAVWYEAHLMAPGFELYGHHQALNPFALLGHNRTFGWSLTMFQNDDMDLVAEKINPENPKQVWHQGGWVDLQERQESIQVKGEQSVPIVLRRSPNGPLIHEIFPDTLASKGTPIALWWTFLQPTAGAAQADNPLLQAFYELNRADTLARVRSAASKIHAPGLNLVWANAAGDIGWWAAALLPQRPAHVHPAFILDGARGEAEKTGFHPFEDNPQEENPARGYVISANQQPASAKGLAIPGYYNLEDRAQQIDSQLRQAKEKWDLQNTQALQLDSGYRYPERVLRPLAPMLQALAGNAEERQLIALLLKWDGRHDKHLVAPTLFNQLLYQLAREAMADELGPAQFKNLLGTRALDSALPRLMADPDSPWWDRRDTAMKESQMDIVRDAWQASLAHLRATFGSDPGRWTWGKAHTLTHVHPLGRQKPLHLLFSVGPQAMPGGRETPNNQSYAIGPAPWAVNYGPSTRRLIDFANPARSLGINPLGQSGVLLDPHYADQAIDYARGTYRAQRLDAADIAAHTQSKLLLVPAR